VYHNSLLALATILQKYSSRTVQFREGFLALLRAPGEASGRDCRRIPNETFSNAVERSHRTPTGIRGILAAGVVMPETSFVNGAIARKQEHRTVYTECNQEKIDMKGVQTIADLDKHRLYVVDKDTETTLSCRWSI
jgi:hypothetical protein